MHWKINKRSLLFVTAIVLAVGVGGHYAMRDVTPPAAAQRHIQQNIAALDSLKQRVDRLKYAAYMHIADAGFDKMDERQATVDALVKESTRIFLRTRSWSSMRKTNSFWITIAGPFIHS